MLRGNDDSKQRKNQREFSDQMHRLLYEYGWGEVTDWVIRHCRYFERMAWGILLQWSLTDYSPTNAEVVKDYGKQYADNLRKGLESLRIKLAKFSDAA
jgi:hypothetical protein